MIVLPLSVLVGTILIFVGMVLIVAKEQQKGERIVLRTCRGWLDRLVAWVASMFKRLVHTFGISIVYVIHQLRHAIAAAIAPRPRIKKHKAKLQFEKTGNHLSSMHDHKTDTALTDAQKKKLRNRKLEERF